ncbi:MAG: chorismate mutase [Clostridia bacterium]|nr:chorismate mutase [Clostridia bacterium]
MENRKNQLEQARETINAVDAKMAALFAERMAAVADVAAYKREHGLPIYDAEREKAVLQRGAARYGDDETRVFYSMFLQDVMDVSKRYQQVLSEGMRVAYSGVIGAFANIAVRRIFPDALAVGYPDFASAYAAVQNGECECAVLPVENSYAGVVGQVMDLMFEGDLFVNGLYALPVAQNLLGVRGARLSDVKKVVSHPQALAQCADYIRLHGWETETAVNTAVAAKDVAKAGDPSTAAIASAETAEVYGLDILDHDINESSANTTKFAVFSRIETQPKTDEGKFLLLFTVNDVAGALAKAINVIADHGFNMKVLRSRPVRMRDWQYYFYVEAEGDETAENGRAMLDELAGVCETLKIAGHYATLVSLQRKRNEM